MTVLSLDHIRDLIQSRDLARLSGVLRELSPAELIDLSEACTTAESAVVFRLLDKDRSIAFFEALDARVQAELVTQLGHGEIGEVFAVLDPEEQAWLLDEVPAKVAKRLLLASSGSQTDAVRTLLGYPQGSVGRRMSPTPLALAEHETVSEALARVRRETGDGDGLVRIPVVAPGRRLVGAVDLVTLVGADPQARVSEVMDAGVRSASTMDDVERVARRLLDDGDLVLPVTDSEGRLVGVFPIADAARVDRDAVAEDHARAGASEPLRRPYLLTPIARIARSRIVWLLVLAVSATLTVQVLELFEATLSQRVALALFVPLLIGIGGNTGSQAATTVTRALAVGDVGLRDIGRVAFKEVRTGLLLGVTLALVAFVVASLVYGLDIGSVIGLTLLVNCPLAATVGGVVPLLARACRVDPAVFSTPFISTFCDATGLLVYFTMAILLLGL